VAVILLVLLIPIDYVFKSTDQLILLLLSSFAPLCALTPLVVWPLLTGRTFALTLAGKAGVMAALLTGGIVGLVYGISGSLQGLPPSDPMFWISLPASLLSSWSIYLLSIWLFSERSGPPLP